MRLENTVKLPGLITLDKNAIGKELKIVVKGIKGTLAFPVLPANYVELYWDPESFRYLLPPQNAEMALDIEKVIDWGHIYTSGGGSVIKKCRIWFDMDTKENSAETINNLSSGIHHWLDKFILFLEILTNKVFDSIDRNSKKKTKQKIQLYTIGQEGKTYLASDSTIEVTAEFNLSGDIQFSTLQEAAYYTNFSFEPAIARKLIRDSNFHLYKRDYRRSILDAASAVEIALTKKASSKLNYEVDHPKLIKHILKRNENILGRIELCDLLDIQLPSNEKEYKENIAQIRNKVIHAGYSPTEVEARKAHQIAIKTVNELCLILDEL